MGQTASDLYTQCTKGRSEIWQVGLKCAPLAHPCFKLSCVQANVQEGILIPKNVYLALMFLMQGHLLAVCNVDLSHVQITIVSFLRERME